MKWSDGDSFYKVDVTVFHIIFHLFAYIFSVRANKNHIFLWHTTTKVLSKKWIKKKIKINKWSNESFLADSSFSNCNKYLHNVHPNIYIIMSLIGKMIFPKFICWETQNILYLYEKKKWYINIHIFISLYSAKIKKIKHIKVLSIYSNVGEIFQRISQILFSHSLEIIIIIAATNKNFSNMKMSLLSMRCFWITFFFWQIFLHF